MSGSGRYVVFVSSAQLVEADRNQFGDVYVLDLATGECTLESVGPGGSPGNGESLSPDISRDGRYVVFESAAGNLLDTQVLPGIFRVFLRDREKGVTRLLSANANSEPANGTSGNPAINADGTAVVFESTATDLRRVRRHRPQLCRHISDSAHLRSAYATGPDERRWTTRRPEHVSQPSVRMADSSRSRRRQT